jgi:hypothetical protein
VFLSCTRVRIDNARRQGVLFPDEPQAALRQRSLT